MSIATGESGTLVPRLHPSATLTAVLALLLGPLPLARSQETSTFVDKLQPPTADGTRQFGLTASGDQSRLVVGGVDRVEAWRMEAGVPVSEGLLAPTSVAPNNRYGYAVSLHGDLVAVGAAMADPVGTSSGTVVLFRHDGSAWQETAQLTAPDGRAYDQFGTAVAVFGTRVLVGSPFRDVGGANRGAAYVFQESGGQWVLEGVLEAADGLAGAAFGGAVALQGDVAVVGVANDDQAGVNTGAAYVFRFDGTAWREEQKLLAPDAADQDRFGKTVAAGEGCLLVGAPNQDAMGANAGAVYVFRDSGGTWSLEQKLMAEDGAAAHAFGQSVAWVAPGRLAVGAEGHDAMGRTAGAAYLFTAEAGVWSSAERLLGPDTVSGDRYGHSVAAGAGFLMVGANMADGAGTNAGAAYVYELPEEELEPEGFTLAVADSAQKRGRHVLTMEVTGGEPGAWALLLIVEHRGLPMFRVAGWGRLDDEGHMSRRVRLPWRHAKQLDLVFQCFQGFRRQDRVESNRVEVVLEGLKRSKSKKERRR